MRSHGFSQILTASCVVAIFTFSLLARAEDNSAPQMWNMKFSNPNLCAREGKDPASSFYLMVDGFNVSRLSFRLATQAGENTTTDVTEAITEFQRANLKISQTILTRLANGSLAILSDDQLSSLKSTCGDDAKCASAQSFLKTAFETIGPVQSVNPIGCTIIKKNIPMQFRTAAPNKEELEKLAVAYLDSENYIARCDSLMNSNATDFNLVLRFDLGDNKNLKATGFRFWDSYRAYMSWAWRRSDILDSVAPQFKATLKSLAIESETLLIPEGCQTLTRPECNSDFLSANDLRNFSSGVNFKGGSKLTTHSMLDDLVKLQQDKGAAQDLLNQGSTENVQTSQVLKGIMDARIQASNSVYESLLFMTTLKQNKNVTTLIKDIQSLIETGATQKQALNDLALMCTERTVVSNTQVSGLAKEISNQQSLFQNLESKKAIGMNAEQAVLAIHDYLAALDSLCIQYSQKISDDDHTLVTVKAFRPWFQQAITTLKSSDTPSVGTPPPISYLNLGTRSLCSDAIDCGRTLIESYVNLYNVSIYTKAVGVDATQSVTLAPNQNAAVACQVYNPYAFEQVRKKKLITDLISAVASGALYLPFYLKVDYQIPKFASFEQLVNDGHVDYDPKLITQKSLKTLVVDFGPWAHSPCAIMVSQNPQLGMTQAVYAFHGLSVGYCAQGGKNDSRADAYGLSKVEPVGHSACGTCQISFEQVAVSTVATGFNSFRFGIRLVDALNDFFRAGSSPEIPRALEVNPKYVADTYTKYQSIPDDCVYELAHNARCMKDLCVSSTVSKYEAASGIHITEAYAADYPDDRGGPNQKYIWMKTDKCDGEIGVPVVCQKNKVPSFVNMHAVMKTMSCRKLK